MPDDGGELRLQTLQLDSPSYDLRRGSARPLEPLELVDEQADPFEQALPFVGCAFERHAASSATSASTVSARGIAGCDSVRTAASTAPATASAAST